MISVRKDFWFVYILVFVLVISAGAMTVRALVPRSEIIVGMVEARSVDVASKVPGRIDTLFVREGDNVERGALMATLQSREIDAKLGQARAAMDGAKARYDMATNGARKQDIEAARLQLSAANRELDLAETTWQRIEALYADSVVSQQQRDQVKTQAEAASDRVAAAKTRFEMMIQGAREEEIRGAWALYEQAQSAVLEAEAYKAETRLYSPITGEISNRLVDEGEITSAGYPLLTVTDLNDSWVVLQLREDALSSLRKGDQVLGTVPALGVKDVPWTVDYFAPMADFASWKATNQKGDFDLRTFEVHLRPTSPIEGLRPGMTVRVKIPS